MQQLSGLDASFLYLETPTAPMHVSGICIYDPSTAPGGEVRFKQIIEHYVARAHLARCLRQTVVTVPFGLDHPWWLNDESFDPEFHIRHLALPRPGDWRQLCIQVARLHARPLDRAHPLWESYVIEGLDGVSDLPPGCFAVFTKIHHAAIDGQTGNEIIKALHDLTPKTESSQPSEPWQVDSKPSTLGLLARAQLNALRQPFAFGKLLLNTAPDIVRKLIGLREGSLRVFPKAPRTRFNRTVSAHRVVEGVTFSLNDVKAIKNSFDNVTVNDVALTVCGGALHHYLTAHDELPKESLVAMAPISVRTEVERQTAGNQVSFMLVNLHTEISDGRRRLLAVNADTRRAKELTSAIGARTMTDYSQFVPSTITGLAARVASQVGLANRIRPVFNCIVTNVPGPQVPLYQLGAKLVVNFGYLPMLDSCGLGHVINSYCGNINIGVTSCRKMMPDPAFYAKCLVRSFEELQQATVATPEPRVS